jgi:hypothetical protein
MGEVEIVTVEDISVVDSGLDPDGSETIGPIRIQKKSFQIRIRAAPEPK